MGKRHIVIGVGGHDILCLPRDIALTIIYSINNALDIDFSSHNVRVITKLIDSRRKLSNALRIIQGRRLFPRHKVRME